MKEIFLGALFVILYSYISWFDSSAVLTLSKQHQIDENSWLSEATSTSWKFWKFKEIYIFDIKS